MNSGALVICDILISELKQPLGYILEFIRELSGNPDITYSSKVALSEWSNGYRNIALCNFIKSFGNIKNDPNKVLDVYFRLCSIEMTCEELSNAFIYLACENSRKFEGQAIFTASQTKRLNAIMQTCGFYDESGEFSFRVGLPGKSGVGGGVIAVHPDNYSIAVWSPKLNEKGNSSKALMLLEMLTTDTESSIF